MSKAGKEEEEKGRSKRRRKDCSEGAGDNRALIFFLREGQWEGLRQGRDGIFKNEDTGCHEG